MATPMNFQSLGFDGISQQERDANRRFYDSLASVGGVISDAGKNFESYLARKKAEEDEKRKWDNMLEQQQYQRQQDAYNRFYQEQRDKVADQRYADELERTLEKQRREEDALAAAKKQLKENPMYSPARIRMEYGQQAYDAAIARENAPTYADYMNAQRDFDSAINQRLMYKLQKDQNDKAARLEDESRQADDFVKQINDMAAREGIDLSRGATLPSPKEKESLRALKANLEEKLAMLNDTNNISKHSVNSASMVMAINSQIKEIDRRLGIKPVKKKWRPDNKE